MNLEYNMVTTTRWLIEYHLITTKPYFHFQFSNSLQKSSKLLLLNTHDMNFLIVLQNRKTQKNYAIITIILKI